jgi:diketogulonate reductase-like aldo/keto reductase
MIIELDVLPYCSDGQIAVVGFSPFYRGYSLSRARKWPISEIVRLHGRKARLVLLNYLIRNPNTFTITKARNV